MIKIIYPNENNDGICIITPTNNCGLSIGEIAIKDVPSGVPYKIIDASDIPEDRTFRDAWESDFSNPDGYGIGHEEWFRIQDELNQPEDEEIMIND